MLYACKKCGDCCKGTMGPFIFPSDVITISKHLNVSRAKFLEKYCTKNIIDLHSTEVEIFSLKLTGRRCIFLNNNNLCDIYDFRPYQCANAPYHFLSKSGFWSHMKCIDLKTLNESNSDQEDAKILKELIEIGYAF